MMRRGLLCIAGILLAAACGGPPASAPKIEGGLESSVARAFQEEATGDPARAEALWLDALDAASRSEGDPWHVSVAEASLDALVYRSVYALSGARSALAHRVKDSATEARLEAIAARAGGAVVPGLVARARTSLAEQRGDPRAAESLRASSGCVREATVLGPESFTRLGALRASSALDRFDAPLPAGTRSPGPFGRESAAQTLRANGCRLELGSVGSQTGVREVVVDLIVPRPQKIGLLLATRSPALLRVGGRPVLERSFDLGGSVTTRLARVDVPAGTVRLVARVGQGGPQDSLELAAWDERGAPLSSHAPKPGDHASADARGSVTLLAPSPKDAKAELTAALAELATGDDRAAESRLQGAMIRSPKDPALALAYGRAVRKAQDLDPVHVTDRARSSFDQVLATWPGAWEAVLEQASLAASRRGEGEARVEGLKELDKRRGAVLGPSAAFLDAFEAIEAGRGELFDRAKAAHDRARRALAGTALLREVDRSAIPRQGKDALAFECDTGKGADRTALACYAQKRSVGDMAGAEAEVARIRTLLGAPKFFLAGSLRDALGRGALEEAARYYEALPEGERTLAFLHAVRPNEPFASYGRLALVARDAPAALPALFTAKGKQSLAEFEGVAERVTQADRKAPLLPSAATAILVHEERYAISPEGLLSFVLFDVRRITGTADVESNAQVNPPSLGGRATVRVLRRRVYKRDGRILSPDPTPRAAQSHADLSQLEAGDAVEAVYAGYALPNERGDLAFDTPDLLPERTGVASGHVELRLPEGKSGALWSHPALGKPEESREGSSRVLTWKLENRASRRLEDGTPKMDRSCNVSFSTARWADLGVGLRESLIALDDRSPEVSSWIREAATKDGRRLEGRALVEAVVAATGETLKVSSPGVLSDYELGRVDFTQSQTARTMLTGHQGSRTWIVVRALRELGVQAEVLVAEDGPFSADPNFPPHLGRFTHPLALVHTEEPGPGGKPRGVDILVDADVQGPPLPAGRISPELRGRSALHEDGTIGVLPKLDGPVERDEVDLRLVLDEKGNARGVLTVLLRGRAAQQLAEAFVRVVGNERQRALQSVALAWLPFASVDKVELSSREGSWEVAIRAEVSVGSYAQVESSGTWVLPGIDPVHIVYPRPYVSTLGNLYATQSGREGAFAVDRAVQYHARRRVELPKGARVVRQPGAFEVRTAALESSRSLSVSGALVEEDFVLGLPTGTIPRDRYDAFVEDTRKTDEAFLASLRVAP